MTTTSTSNPGFFRVLFAVLLAVAVAAGFYFFSTASMPADSPLARMYRTEADLTLITAAIKRYHLEHGEFPPAGHEGVTIALSEYGVEQAYAPDGPPLDGWDRVYVYVPASDYAISEDALSGDDGFFAPDEFQVYSLGADGRSGTRNPEDAIDNITSWEDHRPWRAHYSTAQGAMP